MRKDYLCKNGGITYGIIVGCRMPEDNMNIRDYVQEKIG